MSINRKDLDEGRYVFATVEGGDKDIPDPTKSGRVKVRETGVHGPGVKTEHLKFIQPISSPAAQHQTPRPPRPGQMVQIMKTSDGYAYLTGIAMGVASAARGTLDNLVPQIGISIKKLTGMKIPPDVKTETESNRTGLQKTTKPIVEKDEEDRHELYDGLPSHGALPSMAGLLNNPIKKVTTALTEFDKVLSSDILSALPGQFFSVANFINLLSGDQFKELTENMPSELQAAMNNLLTLKQNDQGGSLPGNFMMGGMINPATFIPNMLNILKDAKTIGDLDTALTQIAQNALEDSALDGLDDVVQNLSGLFGDVTKTLSANGTITINASGLFTQLFNQFQSIVGSIPAAKGTKMFGADSKIQEMMKRLKTQSGITGMKENLEKKHPNKNGKRTTLAEGGQTGTTVGSKAFLA